MAGRRILSSVVLALIVSSFSSAHAQCDPEWQDGLQIPGVTGDVWSSTTWDPDGPGPEPEMVVIGGRFLQAGGVETHNLAGWDGTHWRDLGSASVDLDLVHSLTVHDGELIAVGSGPGTRGQGHIYAYDGNTWRTLGNSTDRGVTAAAVYNGDLYIGGAFTSFGSHIARWSGSTWLPVSAGGTNAPVSALVEFQGELVAGGSFFTAGGQVVYNIAAFDGSTWHGFDGGFSTYGDAVAALAVYDGQLYAAGDLTSGSGNPLSNITRWNGSSWESIGGTASGITIGALRSFGGGLVASGEFTAIGGVGASGIATWDGQAWHPMGTGLRTNDGWGQIAHTLVEYDGELVAAGWFTTAGGVGCLNVASWSGTAWRSFGRGFNGEIRKLLADGPDVYIGGDFSHVDGHSANSVCRWDGSAYHALGSGLTGSSVPAVWDMVFYNGDLIVGGSYDYAGGSRLNGLAAWNGTEWTSLNGAFPFFTRIYALEEHDGMLIAAGLFTSAPGGVAAQNVAAWDGSAWHPLGSGFDYPPSALISYGGDLYAAGNFHVADGNPASGFARWNGTEWQAVEGSPSWVTFTVDLEHYDGQIVMVGNFQDAGGVPVNGVVLFDGTNWTPLGNGLPNFGWGLGATVADGDLIVVGMFTQPGRNIARWDGTSWSAVGAGLSDLGYSIAAYDGGVAVGGRFVAADGRAAGYFGRWTCAPDPANVDVNESIDTGLRLAAYPSVVHEGSRLSFQLDRESWVQLDVYDVEGRIVTSLLDEARGAGSHSVEWRPSLPSGAYWAVLRAGQDVSRTRILVIH